MKPRDLVNSWLHSVAQEVGIPHLGLDEHGVCAVRYGEDVECVLECPETGDMCYLYAPMCAVPASGGDKLFVELLKANCFCLETHGATFAIDDSGHRVILCYPQPLVLMDEMLFKNLLANFLEIAGIWHERLKSGALMTDTPSQELSRLKEDKLWSLGSYNNRA